MNVELIEEPIEQAKAKLKAYRSVRTKHLNAEIHAATKAYAALAKGKPLIDLHQAFDGVALDAKGRPMLAVCRADAPEVRVQCWSGRWEFQRGEKRRGFLTHYRPIEIPRPPNNEGWKEGYSLVPMVPPECLPAASLDNFLILWEVEEWADRPKIARPDRDPMLLRHLAGTLYAVEAAWDLTEVERAIMTGRRIA